MVFELSQVKELLTEMKTKGLKLIRVEDIYAKNGIVPRCLCDSLELTFSNGKSSESQSVVYSVLVEEAPGTKKVSVEKN